MSRGKTSHEGFDGWEKMHLLQPGVAVVVRTTSHRYKAGANSLRGLFAGFNPQGLELFVPGQAEYVLPAQGFRYFRQISRVFRDGDAVVMPGLRPGLVVGCDREVVVVRTALGDESVSVLDPMLENEFWAVRLKRIPGVKMGLTVSEDERQARFARAQIDDAAGVERERLVQLYEENYGLADFRASI